MQVVETTQVSEPVQRPAACTVCVHPHLEAIDRLLASGSVSRRTIANQFGLNDSAVQRHKTSHLSKRIVRAVEKHQEKSDSLFRERLEYLWSECTDGIKMAKSAARTVTDPETGELRYVGRDLGPLAPLLGQAHRNAELLGTATGELNAAAPTTVHNHLSVIMPRAVEQQPAIEATCAPIQSQEHASGLLGESSEAIEIQPGAPSESNEP